MYTAAELDAHSMEMSTSNESATFAHPISDLSMGMSTSNESATFAHPISGSGFFKVCLGFQGLDLKKVEGFKAFKALT